MSEMKQNSPLNDIAFFTRELNAFCKLIDTKDWRSLIENYHKEMLLTIKNSNIDDLLSKNEKTEKLSKLEKIRLEFIEKILSESMFADPTGVLPSLLIDILDTQFPSLKHVIRNVIEEGPNKSFNALYPLLPSSSEAEEVCSTMILDTLTKTFLIHSFVNLFSISNLSDKTHPLDQEESATFLQNMIQLLLCVRYPSDSLSSAQRLKMHDILMGQFED